MIKDEVEKLMDKLQPGLKQDMKKIREEVFTTNIFWVTDMQNVSDKPLDVVPGSWMVSVAWLVSSQPLGGLLECTRTAVQACSRGHRRSAMLGHWQALGDYLTASAVSMSYMRNACCAARCMCLMEH